MPQDDWLIVLEVRDAAQSEAGQPGREDGKFLEAPHFSTVHNTTSRALPRECVKWDSV